MNNDLVFDGDTFDAERDASRLGAQLARVQVCMSDHRWRTLTQITDATGDPEPSVSARLRDMRKSKFGGYIVERLYVDRGLYVYRLLPPAPFSSSTEHQNPK